MKLHEFAYDSLHIEVSSAEGVKNFQLSKLCFPEIESYDEPDEYFLYGENLTNCKSLNTVAMDVPGTFRSKRDTVYDCTIWYGDSLVVRLHNAMTINQFRLISSDDEIPADDIVEVCPEYVEFGKCHIASQINKIHTKNEKTRLETRPNYSEDYD